MNEPTTKGGPEHEIKLSENKEVETEAGDADLLSIGKNNVEKQSSKFSEEADLTGNSGSVYTTAEHNIADKSDKAHDLPLEEETSETPLQNETDDQVTELMTGNSSSVYLSAENIFDNKYDNGKHMALEKQSDCTPMEEKSSGTHMEKQIGDYITAPITYNSEPVGSSAGNNLSEKSVNITLLEKQTDYTPEEEKTEEIHLKKQMDDCITVLMTDNSSTINTSSEHSPFEKSEKADIPFARQIDGLSSEKETDDATLANQTDHQVTEPMTVGSGSFLGFSECNACDKSSNTDEISMDMQIGGSPLPDKLDKIAEAPLVMQDKGIVLPEKLNKTDKTSLEIQNDGTPIEKTADEKLVERTDHQVRGPVTDMEIDSGRREASNIKTRDANDLAVPLQNKIASAEANLKEPHPEDNHTETPLKVGSLGGEFLTPMEGSNQSFTFEPYVDGDDSGSEEEQAAFMKELENFHRERNLEYKPPKFYGEPLNCLKLWRTVTRLGGYDQVTVCKLWRQVGESFKPPKTCTTVSWSFRNFYEKEVARLYRRVFHYKYTNQALFQYEKHKVQTGELKSSVVNLPGVVSDDNQVSGSQGSGSGRVRRDAAARAMQVWHNQRLLDTGEDKNILPSLEEGQLISTGKLKKRKPSNLEHCGKVMKIDPVKPQENIVVADVGAPADWVKINVQRTNEFFEVYALVPGLLREEVQVQSDPAGRLIISGEPEHPDNPWGVTPFKKVITLPTRIDPYQTSAVVTLHGQLFVRAPIDRSDV